MRTFMRTKITLLMLFLIVLSIFLSCNLPNVSDKKFNSDSEKKDSELTTLSTNPKMVLAVNGLVFYTVIFDSQGGSPVDSQTVNEGALLVEPEPPVLTAHAFAGWYREPGCVTIWNFNTDVVTSDFVLYAKWIDCTEGLEYILINNDSEYSVSKGTADTTGVVIIPEYWKGKKVTALGDDAFFECSLTTDFLLPESITHIGSRAFAKCTSITALNLPASVSYIEDSAFTNCSNLKSINIPAGVSYIGEYTFAQCANLEFAVLPESVNTIGNGVFANCYKLKTVTLPENAENMGDSVFMACRSLEEVSIPIGIPSVGEYSFANCTALKSVFISEVTTIEKGAFFMCRNLTNVDLPKSLESIGQMAFRSCYNLSTIASHAVVPPLIDSTVFSSCSKLTAILVRPESVDAYKAAPGWSDFANIIVSQ